MDNGLEHKHPLVEKYEDRLKTFHDYSKNNPLPKETLCKSGFFFLGDSDNVQCFSCGMKFKNWRKTDDPWEKHAKFSPKCRHVLNEKGSEFVQKMTIPPKEVNTPVMVVDNNAKIHPDILRRLQSEVNKPPPKKEHQLSAKELIMRLSLPSTRAVIKICEENDINKEFVRMAIENRFDNYGDDFEDGAQMLTDVFELVDESNGVRDKNLKKKIPTFSVSNLVENLKTENND